MKKYKGLIIFIILLGIYGLVMFFVFGNNKGNNQNNNNNGNNNNQQNAKEKENKFLVIGNIANLNYSYGTFSNAKVSEIEKLGKLKVYVNNKFYGNYALKNGGNWNLFDKNDEYVNYNGSLLAFSDNFNIKVRNYKVREIEEKDKVFLINNYNLNSFSDLTINEVIDIDLDNNDQMDQIICLSSMEDSNSIKNYYSIVVVKLNDEIITLLDERENNARSVYSVFGIVNIEDSEKDSIILTNVEGYYSENPKVSSLIYNYKNDKYMID